jgi:glyoxylase I family protein
MFKRIDHVEIIPTNFERALKFYQEVLGFKIWQRQTVDMPPLQQIAYLTLGDTMLELLQVEDNQESSVNYWGIGYRMMAIEVDDMDEAIEYLKSQDVEITWGPLDLGGTRRAEIQDPDGISIELREWSDK